MRPGHVVIRRARPGDVAAVGVVHAEAWRAGYREIFDPDDLARLVEQRRTTRWPAIFADPGFADTTLLVALRAKGIVGFIHFGPSRTEPVDAGTGEIYSFNVHPDEWGHGASAALMQRACDTLAEHGHRAIHLWTFEAADRARRFYEKTGFEPTGRTQRERPRGGPYITEVEYVRAVPPPP